MIDRRLARHCAIILPPTGGMQVLAMGAAIFSEFPFFFSAQGQMRILLDAEAGEKFREAQAILENVRD